MKNLLMKLGTAALTGVVGGLTAAIAYGAGAKASDKIKRHSKKAKRKFKLFKLFKRK